MAQTDRHDSNPVRNGLLYFGVQHGWYRFTQFLLWLGASAKAVGIVGGMDDTPVLYVAAANGDLKIVELLVEKGADVRQANKKGLTPLYAAVTAKHKSVVDFLVGKGAEAPYTKYRQKGWPTDPSIWLCTAIESRNLAVIDFVLGKYPDVIHERKNGTNETPLHFLLNSACTSTIQEGDTVLEIAQRLFDAGALISQVDQSGKTALHAVAEYVSGNNAEVKIAALFLTPGSDISIDVFDHRQDTPLHEASERGSAAMVKFLIESGATVDAMNHCGETPLHVAAKRGNVQMVNCLIIAGKADINAVNHREETPLHVAVEQGKTEVVQYLINNKAELNQQDIEGNTPLHKAVQQGRRRELVVQLCEAGADILDIKNNNYYTPYGLARWLGNREIERALELASSRPRCTQQPPGTVTVGSGENRPQQPSAS